MLTRRSLFAVPLLAPLPTIGAKPLEPALTEDQTATILASFAPRGFNVIWREERYWEARAFWHPATGGIEKVVSHKYGDIEGAIHNLWQRLDCPQGAPEKTTHSTGDLLCKLVENNRLDALCRGPGLNFWTARAAFPKDYKAGDPYPVIARSDTAHQALHNFWVKLGRPEA